MTIRLLRLSRPVRLFVLLLLCVGLGSTACREQEPSRWAPVQETTEGQRATSDEAVAGGDFNQFFPAGRDDYEVVYTQEKQGFAEAVLRENSQDVATLAVTDTTSNPEARDKFTDSSVGVVGYPAATVGSNGTAILVADRFQVQVRSTSDAFTAQDREEWLAAFDLDGLANLQ